jgi:hypothetical protein
LLDFYTNLQRCGMSLLSADQPLPSAVRGQLRPNNGRYCYFTEAAAEAFYNKLTVYRS